MTSAHLNSQEAMSVLLFIYLFILVKQFLSFAKNIPYILTIFCHNYNLVLYILNEI